MSYPYPQPNSNATYLSQQQQASTSPQQQQTPGSGRSPSRPIPSPIQTTLPHPSHPQQQAMPMGVKSPYVNAAPISAGVQPRSAVGGGQLPTRATSVPSSPRIHPGLDANAPPSNAGYYQQQQQQQYRRNSAYLADQGAQQNVGNLTMPTRSTSLSSSTIAPAYYGQQNIPNAPMTQSTIASYAPGSMLPAGGGIGTTRRAYPAGATAGLVPTPPIAPLTYYQQQHQQQPQYPAQQPSYYSQPGASLTQQPPYNPGQQGPASPQPLMSPSINPYATAPTAGNNYFPVNSPSTMNAPISAGLIPRPGMMNSMVGGNPPVELFNLYQGPPDVQQMVVPFPNPNLYPMALEADKEYRACESEFFRVSMGCIPSSPALANRVKIPLAACVTPFKNMPEDEHKVQTIDPPVLTRCRRCRSYINPFISFVGPSSRWKCNICGVENDLPQHFYVDPATNQYCDRNLRPELTQTVLEYVAPPEYLVKPPQPCVFVFVFDISVNAVQSGMLATAAQTIRDCLDSLPNHDTRTRVAFIGVDSALHFYRMNSKTMEPTELVVGDLSDIFIPVCYDILVNLYESRPMIDSFLSKLMSMYNATQNTQNALGRGLEAAAKLIGSVGGKIILFQSTLPTLQDGSLRNRFDRKILGTPKESTLLSPSTPFYRNFAIACSPVNICVETFFFNNEYADIASIGVCAKYTGGTVYHYPNFHASRREDAIKFSTELEHVLTKPMAFEAVFRSRASRGVRITAFHGNFFLRSSDLLALPCVNTDSCCMIEMEVEEDLPGTHVHFQVALLHTTVTGERRIRVFTKALPISNRIADIYSGVDQCALTAVLTKKAVDRVLNSKLEDAREAVLHKLQEIIQAFKTEMAPSLQQNQMLVSKSLNLFPAYMLGLFKHLALRGGSNIHPDVRTAAIFELYMLSPEAILTQLYPRLYFLNQEYGYNAEGAFVYPPLVNASSERLDRGSIFLLENGVNIMIWIGSRASPELLMSMFGTDSASLHSGRFTVPVLQTPPNRSLIDLIAKIRESCMRENSRFPYVTLIREEGDAGYKMSFLSYLIEDRFEATWSYHQFLQHLREAINK